MAQPAREPVTREAYLAAERRLPERNILWRGEVVPVVGASLVHVRLCRRLVVLLDAALQGTDLEVLTHDMRVRVPSTDGYVYPDLVLCRTPEPEDDAFDTLLNPVVIIEVLSDSTRRFDRGEKYVGYQSILSLREYVLVEQDAASVEVLSRRDDGWLSRTYGVGDHLRLESLAIALAVDDVYRGALD